ncbi:MAG: hypothetical protein ACNYPH_04225 [Gammaproteobacteria bacterium WSBS_2016_MAG_OTU1]
MYYDRISLFAIIKIQQHENRTKLCYDRIYLVESKGEIIENGRQCFALAGGGLFCKQNIRELDAVQALHRGTGAAVLSAALPRRKRQ